MKDHFLNIRRSALTILAASVGFFSSAHSETLLLENAMIHTVVGSNITSGRILIQDGTIREVGAIGEFDFHPSSTNTTKIDLKGMHLYPGLIAMDTTVGLTEIGAVRATRDESEVGEFVPDVESWIAVNPSSEVIPVVRANGVGYIEPAPQGAAVPGQSSVVTLEGWTTEEMVLKKNAALHVVWPDMDLDLTPKEKFGGDKSKWKSVEDQAKERDKKIKSLEDFFYEARAYAKAKQAVEKGSPKPQFVPAWEAMLPYVSGNAPVMIYANERRQISHAIKWAQTNELKAVIVGARDAVLVTNELLAAKFPVVYENVYTPRFRDTESYSLHYKTPALLHQAGIKLCISMGPETFDAPLTKNLPYHAAQSIAFGLPEDAALKSITLHPAQLLGVADKIGSIEVGKIATLFATDGNVFDLRSHVKRMWIAGREINLENRHTRLYEKYSGRPKRK